MASCHDIQRAAHPTMREEAYIDQTWIDIQRAAHQHPQPYHGWEVLPINTRNHAMVGKSCPSTPATMPWLGSLAHQHPQGRHHHTMSCYGGGARPCREAMPPPPYHPARHTTLVPPYHPVPPALLRCTRSPPPPLSRPATAHTPCWLRIWIDGKGVQRFKLVL